MIQGNKYYMTVIEDPDINMFSTEVKCHMCDYTCFIQRKSQKALHTSAFNKILYHMKTKH